MATPEQFSHPHTLADEKAGRTVFNGRTTASGDEYNANTIPVDTRGGK